MGLIDLFLYVKAYIARPIKGQLFSKNVKKKKEKSTGSCQDFAAGLSWEPALHADILAHPGRDVNAEIHTHHTEENKTSVAVGSSFMHAVLTDAQPSC